MQITYFPMASKNIDFDYVCRVPCAGNFLIRARMNTLFLSNKAFRSQSAIFLNLS